MLLLEIRITGFPPQQEFLIKLGFEVHQGFIPTKSIFLKVIWATLFRTVNYFKAVKGDLKCSFSLSPSNASINPVATTEIEKKQNKKKQSANTQ